MGNWHFVRVHAWLSWIDLTNKLGHDNFSFGCVPPEDGRTLSADFANLSTGLTDFPATSTRPTGTREDGTYK